MENGLGEDDVWECLGCGAKVNKLLTSCPVCGYVTKRMPDERPKSEDSEPY